MQRNTPYIKPDNVGHCIPETAIDKKTVFNYDMDMINLKADYKPQFVIFHDLMKFRVREILLVSSYYDAFILEEDGQISEKIFSEYIDLNLRFIPRITRVSTASEAIAILKRKRFDMVITMTRIADMNPLNFGLKVKEIIPDMPIVLLTYEWIEVDLLIKFRKTHSIDKVFYWTGDTRILLAIIKFIEDMINIKEDIKLGVKVILIIEDSPKYYSKFLPIIYTEIMTQTRKLISEGVNDLHRLLRMRARPKIILAETYQQAMNQFKKYKDSILGIISDVRYPVQTRIDHLSGIKFAKYVKTLIPDLPILLQSSEEKNRSLAYQNGLGFLNKNSVNLLHELSQFIKNNFGFGDFVFRNRDGHEIARARSLPELAEKIMEIPDESIIYHANKNHISIWLRARTEYELAERIRPKKVSDFNTIDDIRKHIATLIHETLVKTQAGIIADFPLNKYEFENSFIRIGEGSLGGKARGLAFINTLLAESSLREKFRDVKILTPHTFVICSEVFEEFVEQHQLQSFAIKETDNERIAHKFLKCKFSKKIRGNLIQILSNLDYPLAVRSSSLLEDSQMLPFAGLYATYMLPNNHPELKIRLKQLETAIKLVFASVFFKSPKEYIKNTNFRIEEEKMAVIIQQVAGRNYNNRFYPTVSGVAQSYNFYPVSHMEAEEGIVQLALGLGATIAEGDKTYRFSPHYPETPPPFSSPAEFLKNSQNRFYAIDLDHPAIRIRLDEKCSLSQVDLTKAEADGTLYFTASTLSSENYMIRDTIAIDGPRLITFAPLLKYNKFPIADIIKEVLKLGYDSFGSHIEIEFALNLFKDSKRKPEFYLLQIRPMIAGQEYREIDLSGYRFNDIYCQSDHALGNGKIENVRDIVYVDPEKFDISKSRHIAEEIGQLNKEFIKTENRYVLMGFGRWGTSDPWLGIPVDWDQISRASVIIESYLNQFRVDPSQGSHFFHNITSLNIAYMHIGRETDSEFIHWDHLKKNTPKSELKYVSHIRLKDPLAIFINGKRSRGLIARSYDVK